MVKKAKKRGPDKGEGGRPVLLTPELQAEIVTYIEGGSYVETASAGAGLSKDTFYAWLKRGKKESKGIYRNFSDAIRKAIARSELRDVNNIFNAGKTSWQASAWRLERKYPDRWGRKDRNETTITVKPYVIEAPDGQEVIRLGANELDASEISQQTIAASEETYYSNENIDDKDVNDVTSTHESDE